MASKFIKVIRPSSIAKPWPKWDLAPSTAAVSTGEWATRTKRWKHAELLVCEHLKRRGWRSIQHNIRIGHVQVDIVARSTEGILTIIEVKMQSGCAMARVSPGQLARLGRVADWLACVEPVELCLALVEDGKVRLLPVDALTDF